MTNNNFTPYGTTGALLSGDIISTALDMDAGTIQFYKNGTSLGTAFTGLSGTLYPAFGVFDGPRMTTSNFGATPFTYTVPSGYNSGIYTAGTSNTSPTANAGSDQSITLPTSTVSLSGSGTDSDGTISSYAWTKVSGSGTITAASSAATTITGLTSGTSVFRLTVTDNGGATAADYVNITVNSLTNIAPTVTPGSNQSITLPTNTVTMAGSATDSDGTIATHTWSKTSGPTATINTPSSYTTTITLSTAGTYVFRLSATDNSGATSTNEMNVTLNAQGANSTPIANAGNDITITLPTTSVTLTGSGTDSDGTITGYLWTKISGSGTLSSSTTASPQVTGLSLGSSTYQLTVTDNQGATGTDTMAITVTPLVVSGGGGGGGGGGNSCPLGTTGIYPNCIQTTPTGTTIYIPTTGIYRTSGIPLVKELQKLINWNVGGKIVPLVVDGKWGVKTTAAIRVFQANNQLKADGTFGKITSAKAILILKGVGMYRERL